MITARRNYCEAKSSREVLSLPLEVQIFVIGPAPRGLHARLFVISANEVDGSGAYPGPHKEVKLLTLIA